MKTANLAIVFTDIKGFTARTSRQTHQQNRRMLRIHDALLTPVFKAFGGRLVKSIGDAFLVVFDAPTRAVLAGVALQDRLWDYNRRVPEGEQIHVRVAVNMGEVRLERGDVYGEPVNIAARVEGLADAGEVLFTEAVYLAMNKAEVPSEDRGLHELKGIPEKVRVYRVPRGDYRLQPAAGTTLAALPEEAGSEGPPYGKLALAQLEGLAEADPEKLASAAGLEGGLQAAGELAARWASGLATGWRRYRHAARHVPGEATAKSRPVWPWAVAAAAALALGGFWLLDRDPVERAIDRGDFQTARQELKRRPASPERDYLQGRLHEARKEWGAAGDEYADAARAGERRAFRRLLGLTEHETCEARASAARALSQVGDDDAVPALERLAAGRFADEGAGDNVLSALFGCKSTRAAQEAVERLRSAER